MACKRVDSNPPLDECNSLSVAHAGMMIYRIYSRIPKRGVDFLFDKVAFSIDDDRLSQFIRPCERK